MGGSAVVMPWLDRVPATLLVWYPGMEGGRAFGDVLTGVGRAGRAAAVRRCPPTRPTSSHSTRTPTPSSTTSSTASGSSTGTASPRTGPSAPASGTPRGRGSGVDPPGPRTVPDVDLRAGDGRRGQHRDRAGATVVLRASPACPGRRSSDRHRRLVAFARVTLEPGARRTVDLGVRPRRPRRTARRRLVPGAGHATCSAWGPTPATPCATVTVDLAGRRADRAAGASGWTAPPSRPRWRCVTPTTGHWSGPGGPPTPPSTRPGRSRTPRLVGGAAAGRRRGHGGRVPTRWRRCRWRPSSTAWSSWTATGTSLRPAKLWNDTESAPEAARTGGPTRRRGLGGPDRARCPVAAFTVTKLAWLARHEPDVARAVRSVLLPHDYLTWRLTGDG